MSKLQISMQGSINELINDLSIIMLQHDSIKNVVMGASDIVSNIEELKAEAIATQMKEMINQSDSPHDTDKSR